MKIHRAMAAWSLLVLAATASGAAEPDPLAATFGAREHVSDISLSPSGTHLVYISPGPGRSSVIKVMDIASGEERVIGGSNGDPLSLSSCGWASDTRLVCKFRGQSVVQGQRVPFSRTAGLDLDGHNVVYLGRQTTGFSVRLNQFDGDVIDWRSGDGSVLMTRDFIPQDLLDGSAAMGRNGLGVELVDARTGKGTVVEKPVADASDFIADGQGNIRIRADDKRNINGLLNGTTIYSYRLAGGHGWKPFSRLTLDDRSGLIPLAVDGTRDSAFAAQRLNGRLALYRVALDGSMKTDLVSSDPVVDVQGVVSIGRRGRIIGATYVTDRRQVDYFDPDYRKLAAALARALPKAPLIEFVGASADESKLLVFAGSDVDPGTYYLYTKATRHLDPLLFARPGLETGTFASMKPVRFKAADGTDVPAYLTLPPGGPQKGLPAIVMPHGGPAYRDEWGFDWLVQFFARAGFAVLQPEFRGSTGYGDAWFANNGFRSWQIAIGDVSDGGRWLVKEGIADPAKLAIVGWSYGGYAPLQANVVDPDLFKAVVAIAPATDLAMAKAEARGYTNERLVVEQIGSGDSVAKGSPARHAERFKAPVLMFHGDQDLNVGVAESKAMDSALRRAGKSSRLVIFPKLDHQLTDADARTRMLGEANAFLRTSLKM